MKPMTMSHEWQNDVKPCDNNFPYRGGDGGDRDGGHGAGRGFVREGWIHRHFVHHSFKRWSLQAG